MKPTDFDISYEAKSLEGEIHKLRLHKDIGYRKILNSALQLTLRGSFPDIPADHSHVIAELSGTVSDISNFLQNHPDAKTFGDLQREDLTAYIKIKHDILRYFTKYCYR